ncbi:MAG: hypothetical protein Q9181_006906 [Wetmoreana brouardii]
MSTSRPPTPPRSIYSYSRDPINKEQRVDEQPTRQLPFYVPHVFDLVYPAGDAIRLTKEHIPAIYLEAEAVDSSVLLGHGASFTASKQIVPKGSPTSQIPIELSPGLTITKNQTSVPRPSHVVYKTARVAFDDNGEPLPEHRRAMQSVLTELHALISPPLFRHANIINFLGFAWGSNPFSPSLRLPALIVEYAEHGTLTQLLQKVTNLHFTTKHLLCLDIARGLSALHASGLVHGDVKGDNVLICNHSSRKYIAKISDFGFSVVATTESTEIWMGGTDPWRAPEIRTGPVRPQAAKQADIYSFGLLAWLICLNGLNPFKFVAEKEVDGLDVEHLKRTGDLLSVAQSKHWLTSYMRAEYDSQAGRLYEWAVGTVTSHYASSEAVRQQLMSQRAFVRDNVVQGLCFKFLQNKLVRSLDDVFEYSLQPSPESRDLEVIATVLESDTEDKSGSPQASQPPILELADNLARTVEVPANKVLAPNQAAANESLELDFWTQRGYKNFILKSFLGLGKTNNGPGLFLLCAYHMNGYGCRSDVDEALRALQQAADLEHHVSRAFMRRIWSACRPQNKDVGLLYLEDYAKAGSGPALEELHKIGPKNKVDFVERWISDASGGVGADWLNSSEMLHGHTQAQWIEDEWLMEKVRTADKPLSQLIVNKRGDTVLHFAAMCGRWKPFKSLIIDHKMDIDLRNPIGETPLLCACRSGHGGIVLLCLKNFKADSSVDATNGETPMHWLIRFDDQYIEPMLQDLIATGAKIDATTRKRISHSQYPGNVDVDFQMPGTALSWAVHDNRPHIVRVLLKYGADPHLVPEGAILSALGFSAYYHHHECLRGIVEHLESKVTQKTSDGQVDKRFALVWGPVVTQAQRAADKFSMILRGGSDYLNRLHATFDLVREKTRLINFQDSFQGSLLYAAVSQAHDELVEYMLQHDWLVDTINRPTGEAQRTPLLEAVRWNREGTVRNLVRHGADIHALAANPFLTEERNWSALHIFSHEGHDRNLNLVSTLVEFGLPVDGAPSLRHVKATADLQPADESGPDISILSVNDGNTIAHDIESPFAVALRHNAFNLASTLLSHGADPNHLTANSGLFASEHPLTVLGQTIISNARYCLARLNYILKLQAHAVDFIVEPSRRLTALHRCAMAHQEVTRRTGGPVLRAEFDMDTNADIMYELLSRWRARKELDAVCDIDGSTALHLAVQAQNLAAARGLLEAGASSHLRNHKNETAFDLANRLNDGSSVAKSIVALLSKYEG